jgi:hypothetical protein
VRDLKNFGVDEWICLLPAVHAFKQVRNDIAQNAYLKLRPKTLEKFLADASPLKNKNIANVVAFGQPWVLDFFLRMAKRHVMDTTVLVFDNSREPSERIEIERVCRDHNVLHLGLPWNPTRHANRSHGFAMTWIFHNITRALQPATVSFLDHDLIPVERIELATRLGTQPFFGRLISSNWGWSLWAGYCLYNFSAVKELPLNFLYDFSRGLDTGGRNWNCLYKRYPRNELKFADFERINFVDETVNILRKIRFIDGRWIHLRGVGYGENFQLNMEFFARIAELANDGADCRQILAALRPAK